MKLDYISDMLTHYPTHNHIVYIESNTLMIYCDFGCFKFTTFEELLLENGLYLSARVSEVNLESELFDTQKTGSPFYRMLSQYSKSISIGYRMKFKVIGLG